MKLEKRQYDKGMTCRTVSLQDRDRKLAYVVASDAFELRNVTARRLIQARREVRRAWNEHGGP